MLTPLAMLTAPCNADSPRTRTVQDEHCVHCLGTMPLLPTWWRTSNLSRTTRPHQSGLTLWLVLSCTYFARFASLTDEDAEHEPE